MAENEMLILVDREDNPIGAEEKEKCHDGNGILHRAFTIFLFNSEDEVLIQKRSHLKRLWPLFWETSCSSHPRQGEEITESVKKRLKEELKIVPSFLFFAGKFYYHAFFRNIGSEKEICWVFGGKIEGKVIPDPKEVAEIKWIKREKLKEELEREYLKYAPWTRPAFTLFENYLLNHINQKL